LRENLNCAYAERFRVFAAGPWRWHRPFLAATEGSNPMKRKRAGRQQPTMLDGHLNTILEPRIFRKVETFCNAAISYSNNHPTVREAISALVLEIRMQALNKFGHDSIDSQNLSFLLKKTNPNKPYEHQTPTPQLDPIDVLERQRRLEPSQVSAANTIREVWKAFGRFLVISARGYDRVNGGVKRAHALGPMDVMGQELWETYSNIYKPWYELTKEKTVAKEKAGRVKVITVVFAILLDEHQPVEVDVAYGLERGTALDLLKQELSLFFDPHAVLGGGEAEETPATGTQKPTSGQTTPRMVPATQPALVAA
jgi:hypothetical protein